MRNTAWVTGLSVLIAGGFLRPSEARAQDANGEAPPEEEAGSFLDDLFSGGDEPLFGDSPTPFGDAPTSGGGTPTGTPATGGTSEGAPSSLPRNNVRGGVIGTRAPGTWVRRGIGQHMARQQSALKAFGGATIRSASDVEPEFRDTLLLGAINLVFDVVQGVLDNVVLALEAQQLTSGGTTTGPDPLGTIIE